MRRPVAREKPHFRYESNVWSCALEVKDGWVIGYGYTVKHAWADFQWWQLRAATYEQMGT